MKDFQNDSSDALSRFAKDKRLRTVKTVKAEYVTPKTRPARDNDANSRYDKPARRKSFNPNFDSENRPVRDDRAKSDYHSRRSDSPAHYERRDDERRASFGERNDKNRKPASYHGKGRAQGADTSYSGTKASYGRKGGHAFGRADEAPAYGEMRRDNGAQKGRAKYTAKGNNSRTAAERPKTYPKYSAEKQTGEMRLNRFIAQSGLCSRREADSYITAGLVSVNGRIVTELGTKILPTDEVKFNDEKVHGEHKVYLVLNKPKGYVTTLDDPHASKIVSDLVKNACTERIYPVGRLDKNSLGLLLFTNDGDLTKQLTHPSYQKKKIYQVRLDKPLTRTDMQSIADGITLEDGEIYADEISYVKDDKKEIGIEIHSGRNRIVRRIFEHLGYSVQKLDRVYYAGLTKKNLKRGAWRFLTKEEVARLKSGMYE